VDWSALIFVALAVAWAAYLLPLALKHHDDAARSRTVERFSHRMRVLARREAADKRSTRLIRAGKPAPAPEAAPEMAPAAAVHAPAEPRVEAPVQAPVQAPAAAAELTPAQLRARRAAAKRATKRRRNVLALILVANLAVIGVAAFALIDWWYVAIPAGLLVAWLVTCRIMVKGERKALARRPRARSAAGPVARPAAPMPTAPPAAAQAAPTVDGGDVEVDPMEDTSAGIAAVVDPAMWDPVPVTLPTYVGKPAAARRTVRTIDLDSTGVWTSGRTEADAQLAREADQADKAARKTRRDGDDQRAVGS
jgi:hypothetical protein